MTRLKSNRRLPSNFADSTNNSKDFDDEYENDFSDEYTEYDDLDYDLAKHESSAYDSDHSYNARPHEKPNTRRNKRRRSRYEDDLDYGYESDYLDELDFDDSY